MTMDNSMQTRISKSQFKARALEIFREIESSGGTVIVTDHGRPALEVKPYRAKEHDPLGALRGSVIRFTGPTKPVAEGDWEALS